MSYNVDTYILPKIRWIFLLVAFLTVWIPPVGTLIGVISFIVWLGIGHAIKEADENIENHEFEKLSKSQERSEFVLAIKKRKVDEEAKQTLNINDKMDKFKTSLSSFEQKNCEHLNFLKMKVEEINASFRDLSCESSYENIPNSTYDFLHHSGNVTYSLTITNVRTSNTFVNIKLDSEGQFSLRDPMASETRYFQDYNAIDQFLIEKLYKFS